MADTRNLVQRHQTWSVTLEVKPSLRDLVGKKRLTKSTGTRDLREAQRLRHGILAGMHAYLKTIEEAKEQGTGDLVAAGLEWQQKRLSASTDDSFIDRHTERDLVELTISDIADSYADKIGPEKAFGVFYSLATSDSPPISSLRDQWMEEETQQFGEQHRKDCLRAFGEFLKWIGEHATVGAVDRRVAGRYVSEVLGKTDRDRKTINKYIGCLKKCWDWMVRRGHAEDNPWINQGFRVEKKRGEKNVANQALTSHEIVRLLTTHRASIYDAALSDMIRLGLMTGARQNELASLTRNQVEIDPKSGDITIEITTGKRTASLRRIPIHSAVAPIIRRRYEATDDKLFSELKPRGVDKKLGQCVSREFQELKKKVCLADGKSFHSFRRNVMEILEAEGVPLPSVKLIVGHERGDMSFGVYSKGMLIDLRAAVEKIDYGPKIMALIHGRS